MAPPNSSRHTYVWTHRAFGTPRLLPAISKEPFTTAILSAQTPPTVSPFDARQPDAGITSEFSQDASTLRATSGSHTSAGRGSGYLLHLPRDPVNLSPSAVFVGVTCIMLYSSPPLPRFKPATAWQPDHSRRRRNSAEVESQSSTMARCPAKLSSSNSNHSFNQIGVTAGE